MAARNQPSALRSTLDVIGFLLLAVVHIVYSIIKAIIPNSYKQHKSIRNEIVLITGGGGGLGKLLALRLAKLGAVIVAWDVNDSGLKETVHAVEEQGGRAYSYKCDITNREDVYKTAERTAREVGEVCNCIYTTKAFLPKMIDNNHGHIITVASMAGHTGTKKLVDYCSSKFAAVGFDEALRVELDALGISGVKTTLVCPYFIESTGMFGDVQSRFVRILKSADVADRIVKGILWEEIYVFMPSIFRYTFWTKWIFPWAIVSMYLRNIVPDAAPTPIQPTQRKGSTCKVERIKANILNSANDAHSISVNERKL
ncbi:pksb [Holotrichia oblita]|uniref:Pksb n=1 Tax=Holotrichia oblita TaxID=644536 RepID=A0ACB9SRD7_HOLOL|nr:pksb [Holotrichia oblita]